MLAHVRNRLRALEKSEDPRESLIGWANQQWLKYLKQMTTAMATASPPRDRMESAFDAANEALELHQMLPALIKHLRRTGEGGVYEVPMTAKPKRPNRKKSH